MYNIQMKNANKPYRVWQKVNIHSELNDMNIISLDLRRDKKRNSFIIAPDIRIIFDLLITLGRT